MHDLLYENQETLEDEFLFHFAAELDLSAHKLRKPLAAEIYLNRRRQRNGETEVQMITLTILFFLVASAGFALLDRRRTTAIAIAAALIAFEAVGSGLIPSLLLETLQSRSVVEDNPAWGERNVIIVLGDGTVRLPGQSIVKPAIMAYSRILEAIRLYTLAKKSDHQCTILISGGDASGTGVTEADNYRAEMMQLGVADTDILLDRRSMNTFQNAEFTDPILHEQRFDKLFLVTSGLHLPRALLYFSYFSIYPKPCVADYIVPPMSILPTGYNFTIADLAAHEYIGILRYYIYNFLGWNPSVSRSAST
jgi:uncharacterized SAM-binding protein YcdF (DUF218 family)